MEAVFSRLIDSELVEKVVQSGGDLTAPEPEFSEVEFALVSVQEEPIETLPDRMSAVLTIAHEHTVIVDSMTSSLLLFVYLERFREETPENALRDLVNALTEQLGDQVRIVHGRRNCLVGPVGTVEACLHRVLIPTFGDLLVQLLELPYGKSATCRSRA